MQSKHVNWNDHDARMVNDSDLHGCISSKQLSPQKNLSSLSLKKSIQERIMEIKRNTSTKGDQKIVKMSESMDQMSQAEILDRCDLFSDNLSAIDEDEEQSSVSGMRNLSPMPSISLSSSLYQKNVRRQDERFKNLYKELSFSYGKDTAEDEIWQQELRGELDSHQRFQGNNVNFMRQIGQ